MCSAVRAKEDIDVCYGNLLWLFCLPCADGSQQPALLMGWMRRNPIIRECVLSCCAVLLLTYFTADHILCCFFVLDFQPT